MSVSIQTVEFERREAHLSELEDGPPYTVHGIALGSGDVTVGQSGIKKLWPNDELKKAAETLEGTNLVEDHKNSARGVVGKVTKAGFKDGVGVIYEAELFDKDLAGKIDEGLLEVSIRGGHIDVDEMDEDDETGALIVEGIRFQNLSVVPTGASPSNTLEMGEHDELSIAELSEYVGDLNGYEPDDKSEIVDGLTLVSNQESDGESLTIDKVRYTDGDFVARLYRFHPEKGDYSDRLGHVQLDSGEHTDVEVELYEPLQTGAHVIQVHLHEQTHEPEGGDAIGEHATETNPTVALFHAAVNMSLEELDASSYSWREPDYDGTTEGEWNRPTLSDFEDAGIEDLQEIGTHFIAVQGDWPAENFGELKLPVVTPSGDLSANALQAVRGGRGVTAMEPSPSDEMVDDIFAMTARLAEQEFDLDWPSSQEEAQAAATGDKVSWSSSGGSARGVVRDRKTDGCFNEEIDGDVEVCADDDDPVLLIEVVHETDDGFETSGTMVAHKESSVNSANFELAETFDDYPDAASENAQMALDARDETGNPNDCGTEAGWARANQLANNEAISEETVGRMASFRRHQSNADQGDEGRSNCGWMMWKAWGGEEGVSWAENKMENLEEDEPEFDAGDAVQWDDNHGIIFDAPEDEDEAEVDVYEEDDNGMWRSTGEEVTVPLSDLEEWDIDFDDIGPMEDEEAELGLNEVNEYKPTDGQMVRWQARPAFFGRVVHVDESKHIAMVNVMEMANGQIVDTGFTVTAGYEDIVPMKEDYKNMNVDFNETETEDLMEQYARTTDNVSMSGFREWLEEEDYESDDEVPDQFKFESEEDAEEVADEMGIEGAHEMDGMWVPGDTHDMFVEAMEEMDEAEKKAYKDKSEKGGHDYDGEDEEEDDDDEMEGEEIILEECLKMMNQFVTGDGDADATVGEFEEWADGDENVDRAVEMFVDAGEDMSRESGLREMDSWAKDLLDSEEDEDEEEEAEVNADIETAIDMIESFLETDDADEQSSVDEFVEWADDDTVDEVVMMFTEEDDMSPDSEVRELWNWVQDQTADDEEEAATWGEGEEKPITNIARKEEIRVQSPERSLTEEMASGSSNRRTSANEGSVGSVSVLTGDDLRNGSLGESETDSLTTQVITNMTTIEEELSELDEPVAVEKNDLEELQSKANQFEDMNSSLEELRERTDILDSVDREQVEELAESEEPVVVESTRYEELTAEAEQVKGVYAEALSEAYDLFEADELCDRYSIEELRSKYEENIGNPEEELAASPRSGDPSEEELEEAAGEGDTEELSDDVASKQEELRNKIIGGR